MPVTVKGFRPMMTFTPSTVSAPSSTRAPLGSVTVTEFPTSRRATRVVIVTALGGDERDEPLIGEELTSTFALAGEATKMQNTASPQATIALRTLGSSLRFGEIRLYRLTSLHFSLPLFTPKE